MPQRKFRSSSLLLIPVLIGSLLLSACGDDSNNRVLTLASPNSAGTSAGATTAASTTAPGATTASATTAPADVGATATPAIINTSAAATTVRATTAPAVTPTPRATPTPRPTLTPPQGLPGKLALLGPDNALYIQKFDGSKPVVALGNPAAPPSQTQDGTVAQWPTWSKDGSKLAVTGVNIKGGQVDNADIIVTEADGKNPIKVSEGTATPPVFISWSPDGNQLSVLIKGTGGTSAPLELRLLDTKTLAAAKASQRKVAEGAAVYTGWSPDSQQLLIHASTSATDSALTLLSAKDTAAQPTALKVTPSLFRSPAFSSEGSRLAFAVTNSTSGNEDIYLQDKSGKDFGKLDSGGKGVSFSWSPADPRLAFSSVLEGSQGLYKGISVLDVDLKATSAGTLTATKLVTDDVAAFFWSPDGKKLAYVGLNDGGDMLVWNVYDLDTKKTTNLGEWFPSDIWGQLISFFDQYAQSNSIWSPDSKALVFAGLSKADYATVTSSPAGQNVSPEVYVLPVEGANAGKPQAVGYGSLAFWSK